MSCAVSRGKEIVVRYFLGKVLIQINNAAKPLLLCAMLETRCRFLYTSVSVSIFHVSYKCIIA